MTLHKGSKKRKTKYRMAMKIRLKNVEENRERWWGGEVKWEKQKKSGSSGKI